jgi:hypothetical protein
MDNFLQAAIESIIRSRSGKVQRIDRCGFDLKTPMGVFIHEAEKYLSIKPEVFCIDEGVPGHYIVNNISVPVVVFHSRYLELCGHLRRLYVDDSLENLRPQLTQQLVLKFIAQLLLQHGCIDQALQTFSKSRQGSDIYFREPNLLQDLELMPIDERYMVLWFHGLGHELGHLPGNRLLESLESFDCLALDKIQTLIETIIDYQYPQSDDQRQLKEIIFRSQQLKTPFSYSDPRVIRNEAIADICSFLILCDATRAVFKTSKRSAVDPVNLFFQVSLAMALLIIIEKCKKFADWFKSGTTKESEQQNLVLGNISLHVRNNILIQFLKEEISSSHLFSEARLKHIFQDFNFNDIKIISDWFGLRNIGIETGLEGARSFFSSPEMRNPDLFYDYLEEIGNDYASWLEAKEFADLIKTLGVKSTEGEILIQYTQSYKGYR